MKNTAATLAWIVIALTAATAAQALDTVYLVRHADKAAYWPEARELNAFHPLNRTGMDRAERLAEELADADVAAIYTSSTTRTLATGMPLAEAREIPISPDDRTIRVPQMKAFFAEIREIHAGDEAVLVVGHSNTVPLLLMSLGADKACYEKLGVADHDGELLIEGYEGLWRVDLRGEPGCSGMERLVVKLAASAAMAERIRRRHDVDEDLATVRIESRSP